MAGEHTKFYLDKQNAKWKGVCAGIADYTGVNAIWVRLGAIALTSGQAARSDKAEDDVAVRMAAVRDVWFLFAHEAADECDGCIDDENSEQNDPNPTEVSQLVGSYQRKNTDDEPDEAATNIAHKDFCWRPVENEKPKCCRGKYERK